MFKKAIVIAGMLMFLVASGFAVSPQHALASGGGGGKVDTIKVSKAMYAAGNYTLLVKASSSDPNARLMVYLPSGQYVHDVQNGGGSRYGGTVMVMLTDPGQIIIRSSSGGSITVATTPFQP